MTIPLPRPLTPVPDDLSSVTLREGPPSLAELAKFYPARFTWEELKSFMRSGDLGLLKRDPVLQQRYKVWAEGIKQQHGTITNYLINVRLGWGTPPTAKTSPATMAQPLPEEPILSQDTSIFKPPYFTSTPSPEDVKIIFNDWPYSIPPEISHYLIWSRLPIVHPDLVHPSVKAQIERDGLWGFSGGTEDMKTREADYVDVAPGTSEEGRMYIRAAAQHTLDFVLTHWPEDEWEVAWFVNPPRLQSVKDLSHTHVFARRKL
ncbi:hypothetical protein M422DRAFT_29969 [Sphaerobolus stellatus SS14]|uniref:Uncharacterized protein n=1 Tax=Sphaerobolus stellatus (strain SS14) TaxID=990650 RepID=A0A0C9W0X7_SPHS4|nr:hypothetical protein M422DRAFT_29969 [Sphaerobolus stellatus SS14]